MDRSRLLAEAERRQRGRRLQNRYGLLYDHDKPFGGDNVGVYSWQQDFHNAGGTFPERMLMAANRVGKTESAAAEMAIHATGMYPKWWKGKRFDKPIKAWCGSVTNEASKEVIQEALLGPQDDHGTGWIPMEKLVDVNYRQAGVTEVADTIKVRHSSGGISTIGLKTYEQGRAKWQGTSREIIWLDEEPPMDIYTEALTRTIDAKGMVYLTFTPLLGPSQVVLHFLNAKKGSGIFVKNASWEDAPHLDKDEKERLWMSYPEYERETRTKGTPLLGSGAVYPVSDERIMVDPFDLPKHYRRINGLDFGIDHPAAGAFCALDPEGDGTFYVYDCYKAPGETPVYHAQAMLKHPKWIPNAWPHDGMIRDKGSGKALKDQYRNQGLFMLKEHAHYPDERGNHTEPGTIEIYEWMRTGRFKVFKTLGQWFEEKHLYHRKDGLIVKLHDDLMSATRMAFISRRYARTAPVDVPIGSRTPSVPIIGQRRWRRA